jgi:Recombination endonuclease VII
MKATREKCSVSFCVNKQYTLKSALCQQHYAQRLKGKPMTPYAKKYDNTECRAVAGCPDEVTTIGLCSRHRGQHYRNRPFTDWRVSNINNKCSFSECTRNGYARGYCRAHWEQNHFGKSLKAIIPQNLKREECLVTDCIRSGGPHTKICDLHNNQKLRYSLDLNSYLEIKKIKECQVCNSRSRLAIDHDHSCCPHGGRSCGKCIRGILCTKCNSFLGHYKDNIQTIQELINYLMPKE